MLRSRRAVRAMTLAELVVGMLVFAIVVVGTHLSLRVIVRAEQTARALDVAGAYERRVRAVTVADGGVNPRRVVYLTDAADGFGPEVDIAGIADVGGGFDDGLVSVTVGDHGVVCVEVAETLVPATLTRGACP